jgi:hypothetical protein
MHLSMSVNVYQKLAFLPGESKYKDGEKINTESKQEKKTELERVLKG